MVVSRKIFLLFFSFVTNLRSWSKKLHIPSQSGKIINCHNFICFLYIVGCACSRKPRRIDVWILQFFMLFSPHCTSHVQSSKCWHGKFNLRLTGWSFWSAYWIFFCDDEWFFKALERAKKQAWNPLDRLAFLNKTVARVEFFGYWYT